MKRLSSCVSHNAFIGANGSPIADVSAFSALLDNIVIMNYDVWGGEHDLSRSIRNFIDFSFLQLPPILDRTLRSRTTAPTRCNRTPTKSPPSRPGPTLEWPRRRFSSEFPPTATSPPRPRPPSFTSVTSATENTRPLSTPNPTSPLIDDGSKLDRRSSLLARPTPSELSPTRSDRRSSSVLEITRESRALESLVKTSKRFLGRRSETERAPVVEEERRPAVSLFPDSVLVNSETEISRRCREIKFSGINSSPTPSSSRVATSLSVPTATLGSGIDALRQSVFFPFSFL